MVRSRSRTEKGLQLATHDGSAQARDLSGFSASVAVRTARMLGCRLPASEAGTRGSVIVGLELDRPLTFYPIMQKELFYSWRCCLSRHCRTGWGRNPPVPPVSNPGGQSSKQAARAAMAMTAKVLRRALPLLTGLIPSPTSRNVIRQRPRTTEPGSPSSVTPARAALTSEQIDAVVRYLRTFCKSEGWPRGDLNLPRPLLSEKAFSEVETVITTTANATGGPGVSNEIVTEQRLSKRNQREVSVPVDFVHPAKGLWYGGVGDIGIGRQCD